ncbi:DUF4157 domain-containing protein [Sorangium sp. So ce185]|uniref:eCIS core domain-containing protein n=1 Tax=Sorangium sp. So ce185 TaxID=3133287 RepID=UPI003F61F368
MPTFDRKQRPPAARAPAPAPDRARPAREPEPETSPPVASGIPFDIRAISILPQPVQRRSSASSRPGAAPPGASAREAALDERAAAEYVREAARGGVQEGGTSLPHGDRIAALFGRHALGGVRAHVGGAAADAARAIGADAYAMGDDVAFARDPDLFLSAHEAAHVVQQRAGLRPPSGVGERGDALERQADAAASAVVRGASAEAILGAPAASSAGGPPAVQRLDAKTYAGMDPVAAVGKALDDDEVDDAHELMTRLDAAQATQVLEQFQKKATGAFNNSEMGKAARILVERGGRLDLSLEWMFDEGTSWTMLRAVVAACTNEVHKTMVRTDHFRDLFVGEIGNDEMAELVDLLGGDTALKLRWMFEEGTSFEKVKAKIAAASPADRAALQSAAWRDRFVSLLGNTEMAELVKMLPFDLTSKLLWMKAEGTSWDLMKDVITSVPAPDRVKVVESDQVRELFVSELGNAEMYEAVKLLGGKLAKQLLWMADEGCKDAWIKERIDSQPDPAQRLEVYKEPLVIQRLRELDADKRIAVLNALQGTPEQQMSVFTNDIPIEKLTWATPTADWVAAIMKWRKSPLDLLEVAMGNAAAWAPFIQPKLWALLKDFKDTLYPEARVKVFWEAYGNGATFTSGQIMHFIGVLTGKEPVKGGKTLKGTYMTKDPDDATARELMNILKPGGSSGAAGISRAELAMGELAFCDQKKDDAGNWVAIRTSYYHDPYIIIAVNAAGRMNTSTIANSADGTPTAVGTSPVALTFFQNHVRHEIGHAVGASKVGKMEQSGDDFAKQYGGWDTSSASALEAAYWTDVARPATGWPSVPIAGVAVTLTNDDVKAWCIGLLDDGKEARNAIGRAAGTIQQKLAAIKGSLWSAVKMVDYLIAIGANSPADLRDNAYEFPNFTPSDPVQIYSTRYKDGFAKYSKAAWAALQGISWYALSSPAEMFAEMYTAKYARMALPAAVNGKDPAAFFADLEAQRDPMFGK